MLFDYDDRSEQSILRYAKDLKGKTFQEIIDTYKDSPQKFYVNYYELNDRNVDFKNIDSSNLKAYTSNPSARGELGNILEMCYFGYKPNNNQEPDFPKVGIELKQTCIDKKKKGNYSAGERLSITAIAFNKPVEEEFYDSHVWQKIHRILLIHYLRDKSKPRLNYQLLFINLFTPPKQDLKIIKDDYKKIIEKIKAGRADELSESDTLYLGACTKGATASDLQEQYYNKNIQVKKRAFCLKRSYMDYILQAYVLQEAVPYESIIKDYNQLESTSFEEYIIDKTLKYQNMDIDKLCNLLDIYNDKKNKRLYIDIAYRMLGIKSNQAEEFIKADIVAKSIRISKNGKIKENMSFPTFKFKDLVKQDWESSDLYEYFLSKKFLFFIYHEMADGSFEFIKAQLWNMPTSDLDKIVKKEWELVRNQIIDGVKFTITNSKSGFKVLNNLLGEAESSIIHVRPKAIKAAYKLKNGFELHVDKLKTYADELPNGEWMTKQCFWLNSSYILKQLDYDKNET